MNSRWQSKSLQPLFLSSTLQHDPQPQSSLTRWFSPFSLAQIVMYLARLHPWPSYTRCSDVSGLARFTSHIPFLFQSRISSLSLFIRYLCCSSFSHVVPSFVLSIGSAFRVRGAFHFRKGGFFCTHSFCAAPTQQYSFCLSTALSAMVLPYQCLNRCRFRISPWSSLLRWVLNSYVDSVFYATDSDQAVHYASFTMLASPPTCIPRSFRLLIFLRG